MAFLPLSIWKKFVEETNCKATHEIELKKTDHISRYKWERNVSLQEFMTFVGIIVLCTLDLTPGRELSHLFENPEKYSYTENMKYSCFKQIKLCLHCNNNKEEEGSNDYLFKVRTLLNILKTTLGLYLNVDDEVALDKSSIAEEEEEKEEEEIHA
jgi:hypothetical protein